MMVESKSPEKYLLDRSYQQMHRLSWFSRGSGVENDPVVFYVADQRHAC